MKKIVIIVVAVIVALAAVVGGVLGVYYAVLNKADVKINFDETKTYQTFEGFGASSCWYFRLFAEKASEEKQNELIEMTYGDSGLSLDIFRYNLGAGSIEQENCVYTDDRAKTHSFFKADTYVDSTSFENEANYDFTKDAEYFSMFEKAIKTGNVKKLVIFSNSPHYLLTESGLTNGAVEKQNNLPEANFKAHSIYTLISAKYFKQKLDEWGYGDIEIYISPVNEPQWKWGGAGAAQEGCHYDPDHLAKFYDVFYKELKAFNTANNTDFIMDMYESGNYYLGITEGSKNKKYLSEFEKYDYFNEVDTISMHSYKADTDKAVRAKYADFFEDRYDGTKKIAMSEYCVMQWGVDPSVDMGIFSAQVLIRDLSILGACEWTWWLALAFGGYEDGLVYWDEQKDKLWTSYRYHMYKNFMSYIDVGDVRIQAEINDTLGWGGLDSVAFKKPDGSIVMVVVNETDKTRNLKAENIKGFSEVKKIVTAENEYLKEDTVSFKNVLEVKPKSVTTFVFKK